MNRNKTMAIAAAALSGMFVGSAARAATIATASSAGISSASSQLTATAGQKAMLMDDTKHDCKGKNACKGQGGCKTGDKGCKGLNSCKGNGGCKTNGPTTAPGRNFVHPFEMIFPSPAIILMPVKEIFASDFSCPPIALTDLLNLALASVCAYRITDTSSIKNRWWTGSRSSAKTTWWMRGRPLAGAGSDSRAVPGRSARRGDVLRSADRLNREHLKRLKTLVKRTKTPFLIGSSLLGQRGRHIHA